MNEGRRNGAWFQERSLSACRLGLMGRRFIWPVSEGREKPGSQSAEMRFFILYYACSFTMPFSARISAMNEVTLKILGWRGVRRIIGQPN
jgi:hypothetical protein